MILVSEAIGFDATDFQDYKALDEPRGTARPLGDDRRHTGKYRHLPDPPWRCVAGDGPDDTGSEAAALDQRSRLQSATLELRTLPTPPAASRT
jgi:hypothetical protein